MARFTEQILAIKHYKKIKNINLFLTNSSFTNIFNTVKNIFIKISFLLFISTFFLGVHYSDFNIVSDTNNVVLSWHTNLEEGLKETSVERKVVNGAFSSVGSVDAKGNNSSYSYVDENAFKIEEGVYVYRLRFINGNGTSSLSSEQAVTHLTSVSKKTWGSIKALFR